jgi:hypothetical protein
VYSRYWGTAVQPAGTSSHRGTVCYTTPRPSLRSHGTRESPLRLPLHHRACEERRYRRVCGGNTAAYTGAAYRGRPGSPLPNGPARDAGCHCTHRLSSVVPSHPPGDGIPLHEEWEGAPLFLLSLSLLLLVGGPQMGTSGYPHLVRQWALLRMC